MLFSIKQEERESLWENHHHHWFSITTKGIKAFATGVTHEHLMYTLIKHQPNRLYFLYEKALHSADTKELSASNHVLAASGHGKSQKMATRRKEAPRKVCVKDQKGNPYLRLRVDIGGRPFLGYSRIMRQPLRWSDEFHTRNELPHWWLSNPPTSWDGWASNELGKRLMSHNNYNLMLPKGRSDRSLTMAGLCFHVAKQWCDWLWLELLKCLVIQSGNEDLLESREDLKKIKHRLSLDSCSKF